MSDVFITYASADGDRAKTIADALAAQGWSVWLGGCPLMHRLKRSGLLKWGLASIYDRPEERTLGSRPFFPDHEPSFVSETGFRASTVCCAEQQLESSIWCMNLEVIVRFVEGGQLLAFRRFEMTRNEAMEREYYGRHLHQLSS